MGEDVLASLVTAERIMTASVMGACADKAGRRDRLEDRLAFTIETSDIEAAT